MRPSQTTFVHQSAFSYAFPEWIEITDLLRLESRSPEAEKVGDFLAFPSLHARKPGLLAGLFNAGQAEIVIQGDQGRVFTEDLHQPVLIRQSGSRLPHNPVIRHATHTTTESGIQIFTGIIYFSFWVPTLPAVPMVTTSDPTQTIPVGRIENITIDTPGSDKIPEPKTPVSVDPVFRLGHALGGCLASIFSLLKWGFYLFLLLLFLGFLAGLLKQSGEEVVPEDAGNTETVKSGKKRLNPEQDTLAPVPTWDYLTDHEIQWEDFESQNYLARYTTSSKLFQQSQKLHTPFANPTGYYSAMQYWSAVYSEFSQQDRPKMDSLVRLFDGLRRQYRLSVPATAEMVITCIQEIPYYLIHDGTCSAASQESGFIRSYHAERKPCVPNIIAGVQSPYEFAHTLKGDCDSRSLFAFNILSKMGIPVSIWVSETYGHSVLGVGLGQGGHLYKTVGGVRHFPVELTAKGFRLGMISPDQGNMNNWDIALYNN
jgi:hypothetical protein